VNAAAAADDDDEMSLSRYNEDVEMNYAGSARRCKDVATKMCDFK